MTKTSQAQPAGQTDDQVVQPHGYVATSAIGKAGATYARLKDAHTRGFRTPSDESYDRDPVCNSCDIAWPCSVVEALAVTETLRAEIHHLLNPTIGITCYDFDKATGIDPLDVPNQPGVRSSSGNTGMPDLADLPAEVSVRTSSLISGVRSLNAATDAADFAMGEDTMRDQIAAVYAEAARERESGPQA